MSDCPFCGESAGSKERLLSPKVRERLLEIAQSIALRELANRVFDMRDPEAEALFAADVAFLRTLAGEEP